MSSNLDNYSAKKEENNQLKSTPFDSKIKKKDNFKLIKIDPEIHAKLKLASLKNNTTMKEMVDTIIGQYISEED